MNNTTKMITMEDECPSLEEAQKVVGGYVEIIPVSDGQLIVNEEGRLMGLPGNPLASEVAGQPIVWNALLLMGAAKSL